MSSNKFKIQLLRENDLANDTGKQVEFGSKWCDFFEIDSSVGKITFELVFKSLSVAHTSLNNKVIPLELSELTDRNDRKAYSNGKAGHAAIKEFFINDLHLSKDNIKKDYFAIYKASEFEFYLYYIPALLHDNFIKLFEKAIPTVSISKAGDINKGFYNLSFQQIYYGAPGTGKSNAIKRQIDENGLPCVRTTFHPDSDYSTFVGTYKPTMVKSVRYGLNQKETVVMKDPDNGNEPLEEQRIEYKFVKQAFLKAYVNAWKLYRDTFKDDNKAQPQFLVIEEINRGNCAQIFGDLFQLLDRKKGFSEYPIEADEDVRKSFLNIDSDADPCFGENGLQLSDEQKEYINSLYDKPSFPSQNVAQRICEGKVLVLPSNLYIWATMNTSDQSLFPIDSAFKRRWEWVYVPIDTKKETWYIKVGENHYSWTSFLDKVNDELLTDETAEDKHLGFYFCKATEKREGTENEPNVITAQTFVGKVLFYLWNDVFKVYGIPAKIGSSKDWPYRKFYQTNGEVDETRVTALMEKLGIKPDSVKADMPSDNEAEQE